MTKQKWTNSVPTVDGWYWVYNGQERQVVILKGDRLYTSEQAFNVGYGYYRLSQYSEEALNDMYWQPCEPPTPPPTNNIGK